MARTVLPIVGAVVGAYFGNPYAGYAIGAAIGGVVDPINTKGPRIGETGAQTSQEGAFRAIVFGTCQVTGNVIASGPLIKRDVKESQGKGGGTTSTEHAYRTFAVRVCEGLVGGFLRIWEDDKLVYDVRPETTMMAESVKWVANKVFYRGDEDQLPDPSLQMIFGIDETPAHRGSAYMVAIEDDLTDRRGSIPQYRFEVASITETDGIFGPLVVNDWFQNPVIGRPDQRDGDVTFSVDGVDYTNFAEAVDARRLNNSGNEAWVYATNYLAYSTSLNSLPSGFNGGANLAGSPETVLFKTCYFQDGDFEWGDPTELDTCSGQLSAGHTPNDGKFYAVQDPQVDILRITSLYAYATQPTDGPLVGNVDFCTNYPPVDGHYPVVSGPPVLNIPGRRNPVPPPGWSLVTGSARQLAQIEYRDGALYQNGLGPVLLPDDPNYENAAFWEDARAAAVTAGLMAPDLIAPVGVSEYAFGINTASGVPVPLSEVIRNIHARCNFPADKFDVSELTDPVTGLVLAGDYTGSDAINTLRSLYLFDAADQDKAIVYPKRGKAVVATITEDDIVEAEESSRREQAIEYPKKLHLSYQNAVGGYAVAKATSARSSPDVRVIGEVSTSVPVVLNPDQAAQTAAIMHKIAWAEAEGETKLSVPLSWIKYIASDCFGVALRGRVTRERLDELNYADGVIEMTLRRDRQSAYTSSVTGVPIPEPTPPPSTIVGESVLAVLDISPRTENEDDLNLLYAVSGGLPAWTGATVQRSLDGGANFSSVIDINRGQVLGTLVNDLADASEFYTDTTNVLRVQLFRDTQAIESITDVQFLSEGGAFAVQRPDGSWEVMQYRDVDEVSAGVFDLSYMHRGQLNSGTSAHLAGALFVMLADAVKVSAQSAWIGTDLTHRAVSYGESPEMASEQTETYVGRSQIEWSVAYLKLARDGSDNVSATWTPRHRLGTEDAPVESGNFRGYRVTLDDGVLPALTFDTSAASFSHDASALGTPLTVSVAALNRITGAGPSISESI